MREPYEPVSLAWRVTQVALGGMLLVGVAWGVSAFRRLTAGTSVTSLVAPELPKSPAAAMKPSGVTVPESSLGRSRALRFRTLTQAEALVAPGFLDTFGEAAIHRPGDHLVVPPGPGDGEAGFWYIVMRPFGEKRGEVLNGYRLGRWPAERWIMKRSYFNPDGFVEVTPANQGLRLSTHFTLGDFVTHDQDSTWPKYMVLEERLIDKLELVLQELTGRGFRADRAVVLSGFRAPYYNDRGAGEGMARASRHMFGDAADLIVDSDGDGRMDDLDGDGRVSIDDTGALIRALAAVEARYPELRGGLGTYAATGPRGPFAHIDVRGTSARWESGWWRGRGEGVTR